MCQRARSVETLVYKVPVRTPVEWWRTRIVLLRKLRVSNSVRMIVVNEDYVDLSYFTTVLAKIGW